MADYLVVGPSWVGDMVMAQSLLMTLQQRDASARIDVVAPLWTAPLLRRIPEVRRAIPLPLAHGEWGFCQRRRLGRSLRAADYDQAIILPRSWKSALVPFFAGIKKRVGFVGEQRYGLLTECRRLDKRILQQTVQRFVSLGLPADLAAPPSSIPRPRLRVDRANRAALFARHRLSPQQPAVALLPGAEYGLAKKWPLAHYRQVARHLLAGDFQLWVLGGTADRADGEEILHGLQGPTANLCGKTALKDVVDLLSATQFVVSNDSGLMHIAAAVGTAVHAIYGSTSATLTPPLTDAATIHSRNLRCSPCFQRQCRFGHYDCLQQLAAQAVIAALPRISGSPSAESIPTGVT